MLFIVFLPSVAIALTQVKHGPQGESKKTETAYYQADEGDRRYGFFEKRFELLEKEKEDPQTKTNQVPGVAGNILEKFLHGPQWV